MEAGSPMDDLGADPLVREDLEEQAVGEAPVDEMDALDALRQGPDGAADLRAHALVDDARLLEVLDLADLQRGDEGIGIGGRREEPRDVAHVEEPAGAQ